MNGSRAGYLSLIRLIRDSNAHDVAITDGHWIQHGDERPSRWSPISVQAVLDSGDSFTLVTKSNQDTYALSLPYGVIDEVWRGAGGKVQLMLKKRLLLRGGALGLTQLP